MPPLVVVILAAGQGKRMRSALPKVLHSLAGRPLLEYVLKAAGALDPDAVHVVHGHGSEQVRERLAGLASRWPVTWVEQAEQLGTGHALSQAMPDVPDDANVLVLYGDVPLVNPDTLRGAVAVAGARRIGLLSVEVADPSGYGRILRDGSGRVRAIVEERDATAAERAITEVNTGILAAPAAPLRGWLSRLENDNAQAEFYLTDVIGLAVRAGFAVETVHPAALEEVLGVNDRLQLAHLERCYQREQAARLMREGATLLDPARLDVRGEVRVGRDVVIDVNVVLLGSVVLGDGVTLGPNTLLRDVVIERDCEILANCVIEDAHIGSGCRIGPFARIRPGTRLAERAHVGNFVEIKQSTVGADSKINHLSYVGDSDIGDGVNVGAGTITCNYDGANKHRTSVGDGAFIGSGTMLVAPVRIGTDATIGAGSTITKDAPAGNLTVARARQVSVQGWRRPRKRK